MTFRIGSLGAAAVLGLGGALALTAPPAAAATPPGELTATSSCTDSGWAATWTLTGAGGVVGDVRQTVTRYLPPPVPPGTDTPLPPRPPALTTLVAGAAAGPGGSLSETQDVRPDLWSIRLEVTVTGPDGGSRTVRADAHKPPDCTVVPLSASAGPPPYLEAAPPATTSAAAGAALPETDAPTGILAGAAAALLAAGVTIVALSRRRATFTA